MKKEFKVGDRVKLGKDKGTIIAVNVYGKPDNVTVEFDYGRYLVCNPSVALKHLKKKAPKTTKTIERWVNILPNGDTCTYKTKREADRGFDYDRVACVKLTGSYESEE